ncbi:phage Gp37/Gp68 family protein [Streptomyces sp. NPDC087437]|uniref:phage Gp37/Gp68 family protein n=1 Tax=Streptomyces sp. NPDC087437 TaxID=3365789 RepID=UPI003815F056
MTTTKIEWADRVWNPVTGCTKVSPGCDNCYAENIARRFAGSKAFPEGFAVTLHEDRLNQPFRWKKSARVFVNSMSDLFHDSVPDLLITQVFDVMEARLNARHTFLILTKRHARMRSFIQARQKAKQEYAAKFDDCPTEAMRDSPAALDARARAAKPPANIWLGVSVENQKWADVRIPALLETPAAVRFLSCEPLLGPVDVHEYLVERRDVTDPHADAPDGAVVDGIERSGDTWHRRERLHWLIVGGESGPKARPMHPDWARSLRDQCDRAQVPFFFKQHGEYASAVVEDDPAYAGGRAYDSPLGGRSSATLRKRGPSGTFRGGGIRLMQPGDRTRGTVLLDADTIAVRVGKRAAGRELDGRTHDAYPRDDFRESIALGLTESFDDFSRRLDAADTTRRTR